jgi:Flp pilus assembly protein TadG
MNFIKNSKGSSLIQFALCLPVMFTLIFGLYEVSRLYYIEYKLYQLAKEFVMKASVTITTSAYNSYVSEINSLGNKISFSTNGSFILTGTVSTDTSNTILWNTPFGSNTTAVTSSFPALYSATLDDAYNSLIFEVFYSYTPAITFLSAIFPARTIKKMICMDYRGTAAFPLSAP